MLSTNYISLTWYTHLAHQKKKKKKSNQEIPYTYPKTPIF